MEKSLEPADGMVQSGNSSDRLVAHLGLLFVLTSIFFLNFMSRILLAPLIPEIESSFNLSHAEAGALFFFISMGYFIALTGSGFVSARLNHKRTIILSNTALGLALIGTAFCRDVWLLRFGLLIVGMAAGLYLPSAISILTNLISIKNWGVALAIHEIAPNLSFVAAPLMAEAIMTRFSWRVAFVFFGVAALLMSPLFSRLGRGGEFLGEAPGFLSFRELFAKSSFWVMVFLFCLGVCASLGIYTMLPVYLVAEHAIDRNLANSLIALSRLSGLVMSFAGGWAADRFGPQRILKIVFLMTGCMTILLGISPTSSIFIIVFLQPLVAVCFFPAAFAALSFIVPPKLRSIAVSLIVPIAFLVGGGLVPIFIGMIGDMWSFALGIAICGGFITAGFIFTGSLKFYQQPNP